MSGTMRVLLLLPLLLAARTAAAQTETVVASAPGRDTGCSVDGWMMSAPEFVAPHEPFLVRFSGQARPMPDSIAVTLRGPSGVARRVATYEPDDAPRPICDSVGPVPCGAYGAYGPEPADFGVRFESTVVETEGEHRLEAGPPGQRATCAITLRVSTTLARVYRAHTPAHASAVFVNGGYRVGTWQLVRGRLARRRVYEFARAVFGEPGHEIVIDLSEPIDEVDLAPYLRALRPATFADVIAARRDGSDVPGLPVPYEQPVGPRTARSLDASASQLLSAVFYSEQLIRLDVSNDHFELAWQVSETRRPSGRTIVRIRGSALDRATLEIAASYLGMFHPSFPPALE